MRSFTTLLSLAAIAATVVVAGPIQARTPYALKEEFLPSGWTKRDRAPRDHIVHLKIGLKQGQFEELERHLYEVSDPEHARYGQHLSPEEVSELVKPADDALSSVEEWLSSNGIEHIGHSSSKDWIMAILPVEKIEALLDTEYHVYQHDDGTELIRAPKWSLPVHLHEHVDTIQPTTSFFRAHPEEATYLDSQSKPWISPSYSPPNDEAIRRVCNISSVTPECFAQLYQFKGYIPKVPGINKIGFTNYLGEIPIRPDTAKFLKKYKPAAVPAAYSFRQIDIANGPSQDGPLNATQAAEGISREANLDVQAISGVVGWPTPIWAYSTGGSPPYIPDLSTPENTNEPYLDWINYVLAQRVVPQVITTSYGEPEQTIPESYSRRVCNEFAQLGARGVSLLFSSGDRGVGLRNTCVSNDGQNTRKFLPSFPTSCPYVTSIGATHEFQPEVAAFRPQETRPDGTIREIYASGSGFSDLFPMPKYQKTVVTKYIKSLNGLHDGLYNKAGRGYPDISAQGQYFAYVWNGTEGTISGTSASCPLTGAVISLVNDALISSGKKPLGFLNPWLYSKGYKGFTDILAGNSSGCETSGFPVTKGWDPVTGFGTPVSSSTSSTDKMLEDMG
ncbi:tripeptidyl-peptidase 1 precursor [Patellaria atrata CBS 101060]|uniref:tripeptidyl-peptidase II n=1 Tax=Patellaria atrata CBS 101060 TaxID=1346257 RepID=A0A9P4SD10_9PEZI|nr:tripeptidyl-peptidase 1 precursor [Patellaria atrata CBS 101060]